MLQLTNNADGFILWNTVSIAMNPDLHLQTRAFTRLCAHYNLVESIISRRLNHREASMGTWRYTTNGEIRSNINFN